MYASASLPTAHPSAAEQVQHGHEQIVVRFAVVLDPPATVESTAASGQREWHVAIVMVFTQPKPRCLVLGIQAVGRGVRSGDIGAAIEATARAAGCGMVRQCCGRGIGRQMHMPPPCSPEATCHVCRLWCVASV
jgi:hypothetical protein